MKVKWSPALERPFEANIDFEVRFMADAKVISAICSTITQHFLTCWKVVETLYITGGRVQLDRAPSWHLEAEKSQRVQEQGAGGQLKYHMVQAD